MMTLHYSELVEARESWKVVKVLASTCVNNWYDFYQTRRSLTLFIARCCVKAVTLTEELNCKVRCVFGNVIFQH